MAKELPYFKFEPDQWENGNIQICSKSQKGLFIDLCSMYWARLGELPYALALQKHCNGDATELQALIDSEIIGLIDGQIIIEFLDEQLSEFQQTSDKRRAAANKRWSADASALQVQSKSNAIREDKIREDDNNTVAFSFKKSLCELEVDNKIATEYMKVRKTKKAVNTETAFNSLKNQIEKTTLSANEVITKCVEMSWSGFNAEWLKDKTTEHKKIKAPNYGY